MNSSFCTVHTCRPFLTGYHSPPLNVGTNGAHAAGRSKPRRACWNIMQKKRSDDSRHWSFKSQCDAHASGPTSLHDKLMQPQPAKNFKCVRTTFAETCVRSRLQPQPLMYFHACSRSRPWAWFHSPDHAGVLAHRAICREFSHGRCSLDAELRPLLLVSVSGVHLRLCLQVGWPIVDQQVAITFPSSSGGDVAERVDEAAELRMRLLIAKGEVATFDHIEHFLEAGIDWVVACCSTLLDAGNVILETSKDEHRFGATLLTNL